MGDLESQRSLILDEINEIQQHPSLDKGINEELNNLKDRYNRIVSQIEEIETPYLKDPLESLPIELWQDIVDQCCFPLSRSSKERQVDNLLHLTLVSKQWEAAILSAPAFWSEIAIHADMQDMEAKLAACIKLSADLPLNITLEIPIPLSSAGLQLLQDQNLRIKSFTFLHAPLNPQYQSQQVIKDFLTSLGRLPSLETVVSWLWEAVPQNIDLILEQAISIRKLSFIDVTPVTLALPSVQKLRTIQCRQPFIDLLSGLKALPYLESLFFDEPIINANSFQVLETDAAVTQGSPPWLHLTIHQGYTGDISPIFGRGIDTLLELTVMVSWDSLTTLLSTCSEMRRLRSLKMELPPITKVAFRPNYSNIYSTSIQKLTIHFGNLLFGWRSPPSNEIPTHRSIKDLFEIIVIFAPKVWHLNILTYVSQTPKPTFCQSLPHLTTFILWCGGAGSFHYCDLLLSEVENAEITNTGPLTASIWCPKALKLSIASQNVYNLNLDRWSHIRYLELRDTMPDWRDVSLPNLKKLAIMPLDGRDVDSNLTQLLVELNLRPALLPGLENLSMNMFPEWDILFLMLEQRNFSIDGKVSRIKTLEVPFTPHILVRRPLSDRLRGHFSERPSNFSLSLQSLKSGYFDINVKGCDWCHRNFQSCNEVPSPLSRSSAPVKSQIDRLTPYPKSQQQILSTSVSRTMAWLHSAQAVGRPLQCSRYDGSLVKITGTTSLGLPLLTEQIHL